MHGLIVGERLYILLLGFSFTSAAQMGSSSFTESSQKVQSWSTHSSPLPCRSCGLLQLRCCVRGLGPLQVHPTVLQTKEHSLQTSLGGMEDDLSMCVSHYTPRWQASQFQLHGYTSRRCSVCVSVSRPCCFCLSTQSNFMIHIQEEFRLRVFILHSGWF